MSTEEEIRNTTFFFGKSIPESVKRHFPRHYTLDEEKENHYIKNKYVRSLAMKIMRRRWYPELYGSEIYGLDFHYSLVHALAQSRRYGTVDMISVFALLLINGWRVT